LTFPINWETRAFLEVNPRDGRIERVAGVTGKSVLGWMGLDPDDSPFTTSRIGTQEVYALDLDLP